jgi:Family of unknown function (DUF6152)
VRAAFLGLILVVVLPTPVQVHHSFASYYFEEQIISLEGDVVEFDLRAPHAWLHVRVKESDDLSRTYAAEWANPNRLARDGIVASTLRPGDRVRVTGSPGRKSDEYRLHLKSIVRLSDGWRWGGGRR